MFPPIIDIDDAVQYIKATRYSIKTYSGAPNLAHEDSITIHSSPTELSCEVGRQRPLRLTV